VEACRGLIVAAKKKIKKIATPEASSLADLAVDISKPLEFDKHGVVRVGPMRIGFVNPASINQRRENPRKMSPEELTALRSSVDSMGFKSFILAEEIKPGKFGIVDGHHRVQVLKEKGAPRVPIILLDPGTDPGQVDLAMLSFNVTGSPNGPVFVDFVRELVAKMGVDIVASHVALDPGFLIDLGKTLDDALEAIALTDGAGSLDSEGGSTSEDSEFWQGRPLRIELVNTAATRALLERARERSGADTDGQAVMEALKWYAEGASADLVALGPVED